MSRPTGTAARQLLTISQWVACMQQMISLDVKGWLLRRPAHEPHLQPGQCKKHLTNERSG